MYNKSSVSADKLVKEMRRRNYKLFEKNVY